MTPPASIVPAVEIEVYAPGLRHGDGILRLSHELDLLPGIRHKIDARHEIVYFEADDPANLCQQQIVDIFEAIGLPMRFVGDVSAVISVAFDSEDVVD
ncbi:MAG: hypothetical protein JNJ83_00335 [Verrucomicrobiaceae bacterium]|nr:hypothetical protein [Verrucomicrobiaceae bacterium]